MSSIYSMNPSKYSIKELSIAHSFPLKLRFVIDKGMYGHTSTVKKLTNILFQRVNTPQIVRYSVDKENYKHQKKVQNFSKMPREKNKRVVSQKQQRNIGEKKDKKEELFLDLLNQKPKKKELQQKSFKPYKLQSSYKKAPQSQSFHTTQPVKSRSIFFASKTRNNLKKIESWKVEKWQTIQESMACSFIMKNQEKQ